MGHPDAGPGLELTLPEVAQTIILTRTTMQASAMPPGEELALLGRSRATLAIHLSVRNLRFIERALTPHYGGDCPAVVVYRASWPDERIIRATLSTITAKVRAAKITRTALILVGHVLDSHHFRDSALYDPGHEHVHGAHRFVVIVEAHIKGFDVLRIIGDDHRFLENLFR